MNHKGYPTLETEILMMEEYLKEVRRLWAHTHGNDQPALDEMRKGRRYWYQMFEHYAVPERKIS